MANNIHPTAVIYPNVTLGDNIHIGAYSVIGGPPEHRAFWSGEYKGVRIGDNVRISNHVTIDAGTTHDTVVGKGSILLAKSHLGHDVYLGENVTISVGAVIAGHTNIMRGANIAVNAAVHQNCLVPPFAMIGMGGIVTKTTKMEPFNIYVGNPAKWLKKNQHAIDVNKFSIWDYHNIVAEYEDVLAKKA